MGSRPGNMAERPRATLAAGPSGALERCCRSLNSRGSLRISRTEPNGFVHRCCVCLRASRPWIGSVGLNDSKGPRADIDGASLSPQNPSAKRSALAVRLSCAVRRGGRRYPERANTPRKGAISLVHVVVSPSVTSRQTHVG